MKSTKRSNRQTHRRAIDAVPPECPVLTGKELDEWFARNVTDAQLAWMDAETEKAIAAVDSGDEELIPHEEVVRELEQRQNDRKKR